MRKRLFFAVGLFALAFAAFASLAHTAPPTAPRWYTLANTADVGGLWVGRDGAKPTAALFSSKVAGLDGAALGFWKDGGKADGCDFAIASDAEGVRFQIRDDAGKLHQIPVTALLKLQNGSPKVIRGPPAPEVVEGPFGGDVGKRVLLRVVRNRAVDRLASHGFRDAGAGFAASKPIDRAKARELVDSIDDDVILKHVAEKYPQAIGEGGRLEAIVNWLIEHKEEIMQLVKFLISLLALFMDDGGQSLAAPDHTGPSPVMPQAEAAWLMAC